MSRGGIRTEIVENSEVALGGNLYETGLITVPAGGTIKKGTVLKRENGKFAPVMDTEPQTISVDVSGEPEDVPVPGSVTDVPVAVNPFDIPNPAAASADLSIRALISGPVRADLLTIADETTTDVQNDMLRNYGIIPIKVNDISWTE